MGRNLQALRFKPAPDNQNAAMVRLDVDNVRVEATDGGTHHFYSNEASF